MKVTPIDGNKTDIDQNFEALKINLFLGLGIFGIYGNFWGHVVKMLFSLLDQTVSLNQGPDLRAEFDFLGFFGMFWNLLGFLEMCKRLFQVIYLSLEVRGKMFLNFSGFFLFLAWIWT